MKKWKNFFLFLFYCITKTYLLFNRAAPKPIIEVLSDQGFKKSAQQGGGNWIIFLQSVQRKDCCSVEIMKSSLASTQEKPGLPTRWRRLWVKQKSTSPRTLEAPIVATGGVSQLLRDNRSEGVRSGWMDHQAGYYYGIDDLTRFCPPGDGASVGAINDSIRMVIHPLNQRETMNYFIRFFVYLSFWWYSFTFWGPPSGRFPWALFSPFQIRPT